jgi:pantetheine-phosphate adenylyltransferase
MKTVLFAGTFDPPTLGHQEIIERSAKLFGKVYVGVAKSEGKHHASISLEERISLLKKVVAPFKNVEVVQISGLVVDFAKKHHVDLLVRGIRNTADLDFEMQMGSANRLMTGIETICLLSSPQFSQINSTLIREIASHGRRLKDFVPEAIEERVYELLASNP